MIASELSEELMAIAVLVMAGTAAVVLIIAAWKGRSFIAQWRDIKLTMNPAKLKEVTDKLDEVVMSVNNKAPDDITLFARAKLLEANQAEFRKDIDQVKLSVKKTDLRTEMMDRKLTRLIAELDRTVGLRLSDDEERKTNDH